MATEPTTQTMKPPEPSAAPPAGGKDFVPAKPGPARGPADGYTVTEMMATLPETIRQYLFSSDFSDKLLALAKEFNLTKEDQDVMLYNVLEVFFEDVALSDLPDELWTELGWKPEDEGRARDLVIQLLGRVFLPAQAFVGDVVAVLAEFDVDAKNFPQTQIELRQVSYTDAAKSAAASFSGLAAGDPQRLTRLEHIIESRLREARNDTETSEQLQRSSKLGGLELSSEDAAKIIGVIAEEMRLTKFVEAYEVKSPAAGEAQRFTPEDVRRIYAGSEEERKQLADLRAKLAKDGETPEKALDALRVSLQPLDKPLPEPLEVVAGLLFWAEKCEFVDDIGSEDRLGGLIVDYLEEKGRASEVEDFRNRPTAPKYVNILLQSLLRGNASLNEADSARFGLRVANILKRRGLSEYTGLAAFDAASGSFEWQIPEQA